LLLPWFAFSFLSSFGFYIQPLLLFATICLLPPSVDYGLRPSSSCRFLPYSFWHQMPPLDFYRFLPSAACAFRRRLLPALLLSVLCRIQSTAAFAF
jgi:hypothetical protein